MEKQTSQIYTFKTSIIQAGKTATGIVIPDEIIEKIGAGKKPPVQITLNGYTYRSTVAVMGGKFMAGLSAEHRKGSGVSGGDELDIGIALDTAPRVADVPDDFKKELVKHMGAKKKFEALSYSGKQGYLIPIKEAKTDETRQKRINKALEELSK